MHIDVGRTLDEGRTTPYQFLLVLCTALAIVLDGVDNQLLSNAVPVLQEAWRTAEGPLPRSAFSTALALGGIGMMIGGALGGWLGDRIGRRNALLLSVSTFAVFTLAFYLATSVRMLEVLRLLSGIGLGGAMPTAAALASEYVTRRMRPTAVTLTIVCVPLGGMIAGQLAAFVIPHHGWRALFLVGGGIPLVLALVLFVALPESPQFLARRPARREELARLLRKLGHDVPADAVFDRAEEDAARPRGSFGELFSPAFRRDTLALFGSFFFCLLVIYIAFLTLPAALKTIGYDQPTGSGALSWLNFGGVGGALVAAFLIHQFGSRLTMLGLCALSIAAAFAMAAMDLGPAHHGALVAMCFVLGALLNAVQTSMYALAANVYPTRIRGVGIGSTVAVGRIGASLAPYVGNAALDAGKMPAYFSAFGGGMVLVFVSLALVRRHIARAAATPATPDAA